MNSGPCVMFLMSLFQKVHGTISDVTDRPSLTQIANETAHGESPTRRYRDSSVQAIRSRCATAAADVGLIRIVAEPTPSLTDNAGKA